MRTPSRESGLTTIEMQLLAFPPEKLEEQNNAEMRRQAPADGGRVYTVRTTVGAPDPTRLELIVTVTWQLTHARACAAGSNANCAGTSVAYSRTLQTRVQALAQP